MNRTHNIVCSSAWWARRAEHELVPFGVDGLELGDDVLEIGPGFGATTRVLAQRTARLSVVELDPGYCERLRSELPDGTVTVTQGDATALPYPDASFSAVLCFTMLHHIPTVAQQDQAFAEVARVLRPGGTFAGTDSIGVGWLFKVIHIGETLNLVDPDELRPRLERAGFNVAEVRRGEKSFRWRATKR
jgi:ubiquinone/menaquinone biosynthesis C-methylase UbiE